MNENNPCSLSFQNILVSMLFRHLHFDCQFVVDNGKCQLQKDTLAKKNKNKNKKTLRRNIEDGEKPKSVQVNQKGLKYKITQPDNKKRSQKN